MVDAHKLIYDGQKAVQTGNLPTAQDLLYQRDGEVPAAVRQVRRCWGRTTKPSKRPCRRSLLAKNSSSCSSSRFRTSIP